MKSTNSPSASARAALPSVSDKGTFAQALGSQSVSRRPSARVLQPPSAPVVRPRRDCTPRCLVRRNGLPQASCAAGFGSGAAPLGLQDPCPPAVTRSCHNQNAHARKYRVVRKFSGMVRGVLGSPLSAPVVLGPLPFGSSGQPPVVISISGPCVGVPTARVISEPAKLGILVSPALSLDLQPMPTIPNRRRQQP